MSEKDDEKIALWTPYGTTEAWPTNDYLAGYNKGYTTAKDEMRDAWDNGYEAGLEAMRMKLKEMGIEFYFGEKGRDNE